MNSQDQNQSKALRFILAWGKAVTWARFSLCVASLPIMMFGAIVFPESRLVSIPAIPLLAYVAWRSLRAARLESRAEQSGTPLKNS